MKRAAVICMGNEVKWSSNRCVIEKKDKEETNSIPRLRTQLETGTGRRTEVLDRWG